MTNPNINPDHYQQYPIEAKEIIKLVLNACPDISPVDAWLLGNELKYRLRAGYKNPDAIDEDIEKALWYGDERRSDSENKDRAHTFKRKKEFAINDPVEIRLYDHCDSGADWQ